MRVVGLIAADSIRALLHQRLLMALMLVTLGLTVVFSVLLTEGREWVGQGIENSAALEDSDQLDERGLEKARQGIDLAGSFILAGFYWFTALGGTLVALFICSTAVANDLRRSTIHIVLAKPVSRAHFLLGKY